MPTVNTSSSPAAEHRVIVVPLERLVVHPANANVMSDAWKDKLARNIEREGRYPPVIARPHPDHAGDWQILDGAQKVDVLRQLGHTEAVVYPWPCDDAEALVLLATLNRLRGEDVPARRLELLEALRTALPPEDLAQLLPEDGALIEDLLSFVDFDRDALLKDLSAAEAEHERTAARGITFALSPNEEALVERAVAHAMSGLTGRNRRGRALVMVARTYLEACDG